MDKKISGTAGNENSSEFNWKWFCDDLSIILARRGVLKSNPPSMDAIQSKKELKFEFLLNLWMTSSQQAQKSHQSLQLT